jgi:APA family basic amino acid/polyamine antiporter
MPTQTDHGKVDLRRQLSLADAISIVIGVMIGSAIFLVPSSIAQTIPSTPAILSAWILAGILSLLGAFAYAELGAMLPATGGQYIYLRESVGPFWAFQCGWSFFVAARSGGLATLAVGFSIYAAHFLPFTGLRARLLPVTVIALLTALNYRGVRMGALLQRFLTAMKVAGVVLLIAAGFLAASHSHPAAGISRAITWSGFGTALIACLWAYQGWVQVSFVVGEILEPQKTVPRALILGVSGVMTLYLLANLSYLRVMGISELARSERPAASLAEYAVGPIGASLVSAMILFSVAGALNGILMTSPRLYFAQAQDGLFFQSFARVHPKFETPGFSILAQGAWASVLVLGGSSFESLFSYSIFSFWLFYGLTVAGLIVLRRKRPDLPRPYRMWGYPSTAFLFLAFAAAFLLNALVTRPVPALSSLALMLAGVPVYYVWRRRVAAANQKMQATPI